MHLPQSLGMRLHYNTPSGASHWALSWNKINQTQEQRTLTDQLLTFLVPHISQKGKQNKGQ